MANAKELSTQLAECTAARAAQAVKIKELRDAIARINERPDVDKNADTELSILRSRSISLDLAEEKHAAARKRYSKENKSLRKEIDELYEEYDKYEAKIAKLNRKLNSLGSDYNKLIDKITKATGQSARKLGLKKAKVESRRREWWP